MGAFHVFKLHKWYQIAQSTTLFNLLLPGVPFSYPLNTKPYYKTIGLLMFFRGYKKGTSGSNGLKEPIAYLHIKNSYVAMFQTFYYKFTRNTIIN